MARKVILEPRQCEPSVYHASVRSHSQQVFEEFAAKFPIYYAWGNGATGDHAAGRAIDLMAYDKLTGTGPDGFRYDSKGRVVAGPIRKGWNRTVAEYAWANHQRLGIDYVIYDHVGKSTNPGGSLYGDGWQDYHGASHTNHVHLSFEASPPAYKPPAGAGGQAKDWFDMATQADLEALFKKYAPKYADANWRYEWAPGEATRAIGGYPAGFKSAAVNFLAASDAKHNRLWKHYSESIPDILKGVAQLAKPMPDDEREALASAIAEKVDRLRIVLDHDTFPAEEA